MNRRSFLISAGAFAFSPILSGCGQRTPFKVRLLKSSIPAQLVGKFRQTLKQSSIQNVTLDFAPEAQLKDLFALLQTWKQQQRQNEANPAPQSPIALPLISPQRVAAADLVTLGDYWLANAIEQGLIQPLNSDQLQRWSQLPQQWQTLVRRDRQGQLDPQGQVWAAPYRWGTTVIAYRTDKFADLGWTPTDWSDLWRPELRDRVSLLDQPREVIGLTLKKLGQSYNTANLEILPTLRPELQALHQQAKLYSSSAYLQPLLLGDTWAAVGWSTDILLALRHHHNIAAVVPQSGTALWADLWVRPATLAPAENDTQTSLAVAQAWIDFCWQPEIAAQLSLLSKAASPMVAETNRAELPPALGNNPLLLPDSDVLQRSEFLNPLPEATVAQYRSLWREIRQAG